MRTSYIRPIFVDFIPDHLEEGKLYVSEQYHTAIHKCCCGCGEEVVTPLSPVDWRLIKGAKGVSLHPSIGNWNYPCRSHYFIRNNAVVWAAQMSQQEIKRVQRRDLQDKQRYIAYLNSTPMEGSKQPPRGLTFTGLLKIIWHNVKLFFGK